MRRTVDLSALTCVCGVRVALHRLPDGRQVSCGEALDRWLIEGDVAPQAPEHGAAAQRATDQGNQVWHGGTLPTTSVRVQRESAGKGCGERVVRA